MLWWTLLLMGTVIWAPHASARTPRQLGVPQPVGDLRVLVNSVIPGGAARGFAPVRVQLTNDGARTEDAVVKFTSGWASGMAESLQRVDVSLEPGETKEFEALIPIDRQQGHSNLSAEVRTATASEGFRLNLATRSSGAPGRVIGFIGARALPEASVSALRDRLPLDGGNSIRGVWDAIGGRGRSSSPSQQAAQLFSLSFEDLPVHTAAWSSVDTVFLEVSRSLPSDASWGRLVGGVRQRGQLTLVGDDVPARVAAVEDLASCLQPRLQMAPRTLSPSDVLYGKTPPKVYRVGLGLVAQKTPLSEEGSPFLEAVPTVGDPLLEGLQWMDLHQGLLPLHPSFLAAAYRGAARPYVPVWGTPYPDHHLPILPVLGLLTVFSLLVGPINVVFTRKKNNPGLLLLTVPLISLLATLCVLGYGVLRQGLGTEGYAHSLVVVDQVENQSAAVMRRELILGRGGQTLRPRPATTVLVPDSGERGAVRKVSMDGNQLVLSGDFLPVRQRTHHLTIAADTTRARLEWTAPEGGEMTVTNALGVDLESLEVRSVDGRVFGGTGRITQGATATLTLQPTATLEAEFSGAPDEPIFKAAVLPACGFLARTSVAGPGVDHADVEMDELHGLHAIVGLMDPEASKWGL